MDLASGQPACSEAGREHEGERDDDLFCYYVTCDGDVQLTTPCRFAYHYIIYRWQPLEAAMHGGSRGAKL